MTKDDPKATTFSSWLKATLATALANGMPSLEIKYVISATEGYVSGKWHIHESASGTHDAPPLQ